MCAFVLHVYIGAMDMQTSNTLNLVMRDEGTMKFVKYVSHAAPSSRWDVAAVYEVDQDDTDSDEDDEADPRGAQWTRAGRAE